MKSIIAELQTFGEKILEEVSHIPPNLRDDMICAKYVNEMTVIQEEEEKKSKNMRRSQNIETMRDLVKEKVKNKNFFASQVTLQNHEGNLIREDLIKDGADINFILAGVKGDNKESIQMRKRAMMAGASKASIIRSLVGCYSLDAIQMFLDCSKGQKVEKGKWREICITLRLAKTQTILSKQPTVHQEENLRRNMGAIHRIEERIEERCPGMIERVRKENLSHQLR